VGKVVDVRLDEAEDAVDHQNEDESAELALRGDRWNSPIPRVEDDERPYDAGDRATRAQAPVGTEQIAEGRSHKRADKIHSREPPMAEDHFHQPPKAQKGEHVEEQVRGALMEKCRGEEPVIFPVSNKDVVLDPELMEHPSASG